MTKWKKIGKQMGSLFMAAAVGITTFSPEMLVSAATKDTNNANEADYAATEVTDRVITTNDGSTAKNWTIAWSDEFNANALDDTKWTSMVGTGAEYSGDGWGNGELEYYTDGENIQMSEEDGNNCLQITAKKLSDSEQSAYGGKQYSSARLWTMDDSQDRGGEKTTKFAKTYGRIESRIKVSGGGTGLWPAFWMMPANDEYGTWAASGEIDIMEARGSNTNSIDGTIHYGAQWPNNKAIGGSLNKSTSWAEEDPTFTTEEWHTYAVEWLPGEISWYVDDTLYYRTSNWYSTSSSNATDYTFPAPFDQDFYILLNLAVGGTYDNNNLDTTWTSADMFVDYVRVYDLADEDGNAVAYDEDVEKPAEPADEVVVSGVIGETNYVESPLSEIKKTTGYPDEADRSSWFLSELSEGKATPSMIDDALKVNVTAGGGQNYSVQLIHNVPLTQGYHYVLEFDAKAETAKTITAKFGNISGYPAYSDSYSIDLSGGWNHYRYEFDMTNRTDKDGRLEFNMGLSTGSCYFKNMSVICTGLIPEDQPDEEKTPLANGNHIYNGTFDQGAGRTFYWHEQNGAVMSVDKTDRELSLTGTGSNSGIYQVGLNLLQSDTYRLTLNAKAASAQTMNVKITDIDGTVTYKEDTINLTTSMDAKTIDFTMPTGVTDTNAKITFTTGTAAVTMDDVMLVRTTNNNMDWSDVTVYPMYNGDFYNGTDGWNIWHEAQSWINYSTSTGALVADVTVPAEPVQNFWAVGVQSPSVSLKAGIPYNITFDYTLDVAKTIKVETPDGVQTDYTFEAGTNKKTISLTPSKDCTGSISFYLATQAGNYKLTLNQVDIAIDDTQVTVPDGHKRPASIKSAGDVRATHNFSILHTDDAWADNLTAVYINGVAIDMNDVDTSTSGKIIIAGSVVPTEGSYSVSCAADGYENTSTIFQRITEADGNVLINGKFDSTIEAWDTYIPTWENVATNATFEAKNGEAAITVLSTESHNWDIQFYQTVAVENSEYYILSFDAYADINRPIQLEAINLGTVSQTIFNLTKTKTKYYVTLKNVSAAADAVVRFMMGNVEGCLSDFASVGVHNVYLDNISLRAATANDVSTIVAPVITAADAFIVGSDLKFNYTENATWANSKLTVTVDGNAIPESFVTVDKANKMITISKYAVTEGGTHTFGFQASNYSNVEVSANVQASADENLFKGNWNTYVDTGEQGSQTITNDTIDVDFVQTVVSEWNGPMFWSMQAKKENINTLAGKSYTVSFDATLTYDDPTVTADRTIKVEYSLNGTAKQDDIDLTPGTGHYSYVVTPGANAANYLLFMTGGASLDPVVQPHELQITNISFVMNETGGTEEITGEPLAAPTNAEAVKQDSNVFLTWDAAASAGSYIVYRSKNDGSYIAIANVTETSYTDTNLSAGKYIYKVAALPAAADTEHSISALSAETTAVEFINQVSAPVITLNITNTNNVTISWTTIPEASSYEIYRAAAGSSFTRIAAVTNKTSYTDEGLSAGDWQYKVVAKGDTAAFYTDSNDSNIETATVEAPVVITDAATPVASVVGSKASYAVGDTAAPLSVAASVNDGGTLTYQWFKNPANNNTTGTAIAKATQASYTPDTSTTGNYYYYCEVTNTNNSVNGKRTAIVVTKQTYIIVAVPELLSDARTPVVTTQPVSAAYSIGETAAELSVTATTADEGTLSYQWYSNTTDSNEGGTIVTGATKNTYTPATTEAGTTYYYCVVTNTNNGVSGDKVKTAASNTAKIEVSTLVSAATPQITAQPVSAAYSIGETAAELSVTATTADEGTLSYQWYSNTTDSNEGGTIVTGATKNTYTPATTAAGTTYYYCVVTNTNNGVSGDKVKTAASNTAKIEVKTAGAVVITDAVRPLVVTSSGETCKYGSIAAPLSVRATVTDGGTLSYQWYVASTAVTNGTALIGATNASYVPATNVLGTRYYYCIVTNTNNRANGSKTAQAVSGILAVTTVKGDGVITAASKVKKTFGAKAFTLKVSGPGKLTYSSNNKKVAVVTAKGKVKIKGTGIATITVKAAGNTYYNAAVKKISIQVSPKKTKVATVKSLASKSITLTWKKNKKATGYQIQYSTNSKFKSAKTITIKKNSTLKKTIKKLKAGKKYYVRIRAYKKSGSKKVYSSWSAKKAVRVKK